VGHWVGGQPSKQRNLTAAYRYYAENRNEILARSNVSLILAPPTWAFSGFEVDVVNCMPRFDAAGRIAAQHYEFRLRQDAHRS